MSVLLGTTATGANSANSNSGGIAFATRLQCILAGDMDTLFLRCGATVGAAGSTHWAVYSDGGGGAFPGSRLTADLSGTAFVANTYSGVPVSPALTLVLGTFYWLSVNVTGVTIDYTDFSTSGGASSDDNTGGAMPATWTQTGGPFVNTINMRGEGSTAVAGPTNIEKGRRRLTRVG